MAFDVVYQWTEAAPLNLYDVERSRDWLAPENCRMALKWRQAVLRVVTETLDQISWVRASDDELIWKDEARLRASNFMELGFADIYSGIGGAKRYRYEDELASISALAGAYRVLAKCNGVELVEAEHLLKRFLDNLFAAYKPVCEMFTLDLRLSSLKLSPQKCRALVLCAGMLLQGMLRQGLKGGFSGHLRIALLRESVSEYALEFNLAGRKMSFVGSPEFELACRLCGVFQAEISCNDAYDDRARVLLTFPVRPQESGTVKGCVATH